jgi:AcrR family transcriptional regulator
VARTQEQRKADTRARLLDAAADLFAHRGYHAVSADTVADAAERTSGAIYAHFGSKDGLLREVIRQQEGAAVDAIAAAVTDVDDPLERCEALWRAFAGHDEHVDSWLLLEHELWLWAARATDDDAGAVARRYSAGRAGIAEAARTWTDGEADAPALPNPPDATASLVLGLLLGLHMQRRVDPDAISDETAAAGLALLLGLRQPDRTATTGG